MTAARISEEIKMKELMLFKMQSTNVLFLTAGVLANLTQTLADMLLSFPTFDDILEEFEEVTVTFRKILASNVLVDRKSVV